MAWLPHKIMLLFETKRVHDSNVTTRFQVTSTVDDRTSSLRCLRPMSLVDMGLFLCFSLRCYAAQRCTVLQAAKAVRWQLMSLNEKRVGYQRPRWAIKWLDTFLDHLSVFEMPYGFAKSWKYSHSFDAVCKSFIFWTWDSRNAKAYYAPALIFAEGLRQKLKSLELGDSSCSHYLLLWQNHAA